jgi:hypothetical protein
MIVKRGIAIVSCCYRAGDFFFETGDISHRVNNKSGELCTHLLFEILPVDLSGASLILPRDQPAR